MSLILLQVAPLMTEALTPAPTTTEAEADPTAEADPRTDADNIIMMEPYDEDGTNGGVTMTLSPLVVATVTFLVAIACY